MTAEQILENYAQRRLAGSEPLSNDIAKTFMGFFGNLRVPSQLEGFAALNVAAMLASPTFNTVRNEGETQPEAIARRACDYAEALVSELAKRERKDVEGGR